MCVAGAHEPSSTPLHTRCILEDALECSPRPRSLRIFQIRRVPRSINASKIKSPSLVNPANFSPKRRNIWSRRRTPSRGGNWRGTPFLGLLNLGEGRFRSTGSFFQFSVDTVSPRGFAKRNADRILSSAFLELSSRAKSLGILIEIDEKISGKFTRNIYQNIPFPGIPSELQSVSGRNFVPIFRSVRRAIEKFFQKKLWHENNVPRKIRFLRT